MEKPKTFIEAYVKMKRDEMEECQDSFALATLIEELFEMLLATDETIHVLRDGR